MKHFLFALLCSCYPLKAFSNANLQNQKDIRDIRRVVIQQQEQIEKLKLAINSAINAKGEWIGQPTNLIGTKGLRGPQGDKGVKGPSGEKGDKGASGKNGPKGFKGERGSKGDRGARGDNGINAKCFGRW